MRERVRCRYCGCLFYPDPRCKNPKACRDPACKRKRKYKSDKLWRESDPELMEDRRKRTRDWLANHPGYLKNFRKEHHGYMERNRQKQRERRKRVRVDISASKLPKLPDKQGKFFKLVPFGEGVDISAPILVQRIDFEGNISQSPPALIYPP